MTCPAIAAKPIMNETNSIAIFANAWFWGPQLRFSKLNGVAKVIAGYSGGSKPNPTYRNIMDSTESVWIEFDPDVIAFEDLVVEWARMHSPTRKTSTQYRSVLFYADEEQKMLAEDAVRALKQQRGVIYVDIEPMTTFYKAEEYHQNYLSKKGMK